MSLLAIKPLAVYLCGGLLQISIITSSDVLPQLELFQMWLKMVSRYARIAFSHESAPWISKFCLNRAKNHSHSNVNRDVLTKPYNEL